MLAKERKWHFCEIFFCRISLPDCVKQKIEGEVKQNEQNQNRNVQNVAEFLIEGLVYDSFEKQNEELPKAVNRKKYGNVRKILKKEGLDRINFERDQAKNKAHKDF